MVSQLLMCAVFHLSYFIVACSTNNALFVLQVTIAVVEAWERGYHVHENGRVYTNNSPFPTRIYEICCNKNNHNLFM